jgi:hypothetical protein
MVESGGKLDDPMAEPDPLRALTGRCQEDLRSTRMRVLFQEVVLDCPDIVKAQVIGQLDLLECFLQELFLGPFVPRTGYLMLIEQTESHGTSLRD